MVTDRPKVITQALEVNLSASLRKHRGAVALLLLLGMAVTYDPFADGPPHLYIVQLAKQLLFVVTVYILSYWPQRRGHAVLSRLAMAVAVGIVLVLALQHGFRLLHPARWGVVYAELADDFSGPVIAEGRWGMWSDVSTSVQVQDGTLYLAPPPATQAFVELLLPSNPTFPGGERWLPVELYDAPYEEELTWRGEVQVEREYFIVLLWGMLLIQRTPYGLHITYPDAAGSPEGHGISFAFPDPSQAHTWRVLRRSSRIALAVDDQVVWSAAAEQGHLNQLPRFGESRTDELHAGRLTLDWVRYRRWLPRELRLGGEEVFLWLDHTLGGRLGIGHLTVGVSSKDARTSGDRPEK